MQSRLLVLNPDPVFEDQILELLESFDALEVRIVRSVADAVQILISEDFDGFLVEGDAPLATEAATLARQHFPSLKIICAPWQRATAEMVADAGQQRVTLASGARKRREVIEFVDSIEGERPVSTEGIDPCHSLIGNLNQFSAAEILQMACLSQSSGRFTFKSGRGISEIYLHHGSVRHALYGSLDGEAAVAEIFRWRQGRFYFEEGIISQAQTVDRPWAHLLLDNLQKLDETLHSATMAL